MNPNPKVVEMPKAARMKAFMIYPSDWQSSKHVEMMDDHEEIAYIRLLMRASQEPDCGLPDNDYELAALSKMGLKWFKPTRERGKRIAIMDPETNKVKLNELGKPVFMTAGDKLRKCFLFRPSSEQSQNGRIYNERLYKEFLRYHSFKTEKREATRRYRDRSKGENVMDTGTPTDRTHGPHLPPPTSEVSTTEVFFPSEDSLSFEPPPPLSTVDEGVVGANVNNSDVDTETTTLREHCTKLELPNPSPGLTKRILAKFPGMSMNQIVQYLPRFNGQNSPGLWDSRSRADLEAESNSQAKPKPAQKSKIDQLFERLG